MNRAHSPTSPTSQLMLILQPFRHFIYVTAHSPTLSSLYLRHSTFFHPSVASPTLQLILQPFFRFSYVTGSSLTSPGEPPMGELTLGNYVRMPMFLYYDHTVDRGKEFLLSTDSDDGV